MILLGAPLAMSYENDDDDEEEEGVSVLVLQLSTIIIIHKQLECAENVVCLWRELLGLREDVVRT